MVRIFSFVSGFETFRCLPIGRKDWRRERRAQNADTEIYQPSRSIGTRFPMVMNVACRTVSGTLSIKGDHSDIMYALNTGWLILFLKMMGSTKHLCEEKHSEILGLIQQEVDLRWKRLKALSGHPEL